MEADEEPPGLRDRNKRAARDAIAAAALRIAIEQGPGGLKLVRVADIAAAAGVAPRTYNNYFASREEAICAFQADRAQRLGRALRARPAAEPLRAAVTEAAVTVFTDPEPDRAGLAMIMSTPELRGEALKAFTMAEAPLAAAIAERTGARDPLTTDVQAAAIAAAVRVAGRHWLTVRTPADFAGVLRAALRHIVLEEDS
ncbi:TetR family transcriptional regulator [Dactylosporangium sp. NPDC051541]|uniref:acyl-CoA-like ligand-binding transcription factor n=1 Tax=Dactylosporangium sp. NPDC051541 TaxID=3363977 RepID=UPI0037B72DDE